MRARIWPLLGCPLSVAAALLALAPEVPSLNAQSDSPIALVVHGGAGTITRENMTAEQESAYRATLEEGLTAGYRILSSGGTALDAVEAVVRLYEDSPLFNAGKGAVFTAEGRNELDAAIMDGASLQAGAVAGVTTIKNPISAARAVMEHTEHVMLSGPGAEAFAASVGLEIVEPGYFFTQRRWDSLERARAQSEPPGESPEPPPGTDATSAMGTVGALALDRRGHLAAATSTGGRTNKRFGRIGDSPIIGAGTYADGNCAVSATGTGEYFMRHVVAYDICARSRYLGQSAAAAARHVIHEILPSGTGGVITLDSNAEPALVFNTEGMYRGWVLGDGKPVIEIYR